MFRNALNVCQHFHMFIIQSVVNRNKFILCHVFNCVASESQFAQREVVCSETLDIAGNDSLLTRCPF